jgi:hypothetical protein
MAPTSVSSKNKVEKEGSKTPAEEPEVKKANVDDEGEDEVEVDGDDDEDEEEYEIEKVLEARKGKFPQVSSGSSSNVFQICQIILISDYRVGLGILSNGRDTPIVKTAGWTRKMQRMY